MIARNSRELLPGGGDSTARVDEPIFKAMQFGHNVIHAALSELRKAVIREYGQVPIERLNGLYEPLWSKIFGVLGIGATLPVFTTNYDPAVEEFCEQDQDVLVNGFSVRVTGSHERFWTRAVFDMYSAQSSKRNVVLFKLHGSANWARDQRTGRIRYSPPVHLLNEPFENSIIYPSTRKVAIDDPFSTAYEYFQRCCEHANLCIVIGYSFRDYDALTRLRSAARFNPDLRVIVISPGAHLLKDLLNGITFEPLNLFFTRVHQGYLSELESAISNAKASGPEAKRPGEGNLIERRRLVGLRGLGRSCRMAILPICTAGRATIRWR